MEEEKKSQDAAGEQEAERQPESEHQGGPSDEMKMRRLEEEARKLREEKERLAREKDELLESQRLADRRSLSDDDRFKADRDDFYRDKAKADTLRSLESELAGVPESIKNRLADDPFKWVDKDTLQFELMKVDTDDPAQVWEATAKAAKKSLPSFLADMKVPAGEQGKGDSALGSNPASQEGDRQIDPDSLWSMDIEDLRNLKKTLK